MKLFSIILFSFLLFFASCKKRLFDSRNKYIGEYQFSVQKNSWVTGISNTSTAYLYSGNITYGSIRKDILINFSDNASLEVEIQDDNTWFAHKTNGKFESNSKVIFIATIGGLGAADSYSVEGIKKQ